MKDHLLSFLPYFDGRRAKQVMVSLTTLSLCVAHSRLQSSDCTATKVIMGSNGQRRVKSINGDLVGQEYE